MTLKDKVAIVTGGSRGIGKAICLAFAREGARVVVAARTEEEGGRLPGTIHQTVDEIKALGGEALAMRTDITDDEAVAAMARQTLDTFGRIDILVNNAAANINAMVADLPVKRWDLMMRVNLRGTFVCTKAVIPAMMAQRSGNIMAMTSIAAKRLAPPGEICYSITKSGIELFCWGLAKELKEYNIAVNDLYPTGGVTTDGFKYVFRKKKLNEDLLKQMKSPERIAQAAAWIACQDAGTFSGNSVNDDEVFALMEKWD
jgi:citronellol/citronellal dehydrogenase